MDILLFTDSLGSGGAQRQLVGLAIMLKKKGFGIKVCTYHDIPFYKKELDEEDVSNIIIPNAGNSFKRIFAIHGFFRKEKPDYVIAYQETPSVLACLCKVIGCRYKLIVSERNTTQTIGWREKIRFRLYQRANVIVPNSYTQGDFISAHFPKLINKITVIPNFVDLKKYIPTYHIRKKIPEVIIVATVFPPKNTKTFIHAIKFLVDKKIDFHFSWYGLTESTKENMNYMRECTELIKDLDLEDKICLLPKTKRIIEKYRESDYFCLPSLYEGTPNVICEAMACGLPVICSNICDNSKYVQNNDNGFLFDPRNAEDIANKLLKALQLTEKKYSDFCSNSRKKAELYFCETTFINRYLTLIE